MSGNRDSAPGVMVGAAALESYVTALFAAAGLPEDRARSVAEVLVWADLRGIDSHGVFRVPNYLNALGGGRMNPDAPLTWVSGRGALCLLDADRAPGPWAMREAMSRAIGLAREHGVGWVILRDTTHTGPAGFYARQAAEAGMAGIAMSGSQPIMAYHGARAPGAATNPIAIAVPRAGGPPLSLDMSSAAIAWGKLAQARGSGAALPEGVAVDAAGRPTTDPDRAAMPLPAAGAKGAGLSVMIECLTSIMAGVPLLVAGMAGRARPAWQHGLTVAIDVAAVARPEAFARDVAELADMIRDLPSAEGVDAVLPPGERGDRARERRLREGIPLPGDLWDQLAEIGRRLGVDPPDARR